MMLSKLIWQPLAFLVSLASVLGGYTPHLFAATASDVVKSVTIRAPRDIGYFVGDLVRAEVTLVVSRDAVIETASLPHPGPITYWLDLRSLDVAEQNEARQKRYVLKLLYQNFYDALDARQQEIPAFTVSFKIGNEAVSVNVSAWTIGVSPLREIAPPPKDDPKNYMRGDQPAPFVPTERSLQTATFMTACALIAFGALAFDRVWWPFRRPARRPFAEAVARLRRLRLQRGGEAGYLEALLILHRSVDRTDGRRVLAEDVPVFLSRHPAFEPLADSITRFFAASRRAFFRSDPAGSRQDLPFSTLERFARQMAESERRRT